MSAKYSYGFGLSNSMCGTLSGTASTGYSTCWERGNCEMRTVGNTIVKLHIWKYKCYNDTSIEEEVKKLEVEKSTREDLYPNVNAKYMYVVTTRDIKSGDEITANYNLYTYPKTGIGLQMI